MKKKNLKAFFLIFHAIIVVKFTYIINFVQEGVKLHSPKLKTMAIDITKLKIDKYKHFHLENIPQNLDLGLQSEENNIEVIIYYIDKLTDVEEFVKLCTETELPQDNRTIMIYKKGRKDGVKRDTIIMPFKNKVYPNFQLKSPMLCSLSKEYSAFVMSKNSN